MNTVPSATKNRYMYPITFTEYQAFIGLMMLAGVFRVHREPISKLYCVDPNLSRPIFKATLPRERFKVINTFLGIDDFRTRLERIKTNRLAPIKEVFEKLNCSLRESYNHKSFLRWTTLMSLTSTDCLCTVHALKARQYGIKIFVIADSLTFYPVNIEAYTDKNQLSNKPVDVVLRLPQHLRAEHVIIEDNFLHIYKKLLNLCIQHFCTLRKSEEKFLIGCKL